MQDGRGASTTLGRAGSTLPAGETDEARVRAERVMATVLIAARVAQLGFSALLLWTDRRAYARPRLQTALLGAVAIETAWAARRAWRAGRYRDGALVWTDVSTSAVALALCQAGLTGGRGANWAKNQAIGAAMCAAALEQRQRVLAVTALAGTGAAVGLRASGRDRRAAGVALAVNDAVSWIGSHAAAHAYERSQTRSAALLDQARAAAAVRAAAAAEEAERSQAFEQLHRTTADAARSIAAVVGTDPGRAQALARIEAARLRYALRHDGEARPSVIAALEGLVSSRSAEGPAIELVTAEIDVDVSAEDRLRLLEQATAVLDDAVRRGATRVVLRGSVAHDPQRDRSELLVSFRDRGAPGHRGRRVEVRVPAAPFAVDASRAGAAGRSDPEGEDTEELDRAAELLTGALQTWRLAGLVTGLVTTVAGWRRFRRADLAGLVLAGTVAESAWLLWRRRRRARLDDPLAALVDGLAAALALTGNRASVREADRVTWLTWVPWSLAANAISGQAIAVERTGRSAAGGATIAVTMAAAVAGEPEDAAGTFVAGALFWTVARQFRAWLLGTASALAEARGEAVRQQAALAAARERAAQLRLLHDHAVQTLEAVAGGLVTDPALIRDRALAEAARLDAARSGARGRSDVTFPATLRFLAADFSDDWPITLAIEDVPGLSSAVAAALGEAAREALLNARKHAGARHVVIACGASDGGVEVTVTDDGRGFEPDAARAGFGLDESIVNRMVDVGGRATVASGPGGGTRVVLWGPA